MRPLWLKKLIATCYDGSPVAYTQLDLFGEEMSHAEARRMRSDESQPVLYLPPTDEVISKPRNTRNSRNHPFGKLAIFRVFRVFRGLNNRQAGGFAIGSDVWESVGLCPPVWRC